jgi:hypothetical protein
MRIRFRIRIRNTGFFLTDCWSCCRSTSQLKKGGGGGGGGGGLGSLGKELSSSGCSWRGLAILFIVLTIAMAATLAFLIGRKPSCQFWRRKIRPGMAKIWAAEKKIQHSGE